jgi:hypothetical protein
VLLTERTTHSILIYETGKDIKEYLIHSLILQIRELRSREAEPFVPCYVFANRLE